MLYLSVHAPFKRITRPLIGISHRGIKCREMTSKALSRGAGDTSWWSPLEATTAPRVRGAEGNQRDCQECQKHPQYFPVAALPGSSSKQPCTGESNGQSLPATWNESLGYTACGLHRG